MAGIERLLDFGKGVIRRSSGILFASTFSERLRKIWAETKRTSRSLPVADLVLDEDMLVTAGRRYCQTTGPDCRMQGRSYSSSSTHRASSIVTMCTAANRTEDSINHGASQRLPHSAGANQP